MENTLNQSLNDSAWWFHLNDKLIMLLLTHMQYLYVIPTYMDLIQQEASEVII